MKPPPTCPQCGAHEFERLVPTTSRTLFKWNARTGRLGVAERGEVDNEDSVATVQCDGCGHVIPRDYLEAWL